MSRTTLVGLVLLLGMVAVLVWQGGGAPDAVSETTAEGAPRYRIEKLNALRTDANGQPLVRLTADQADYFDGGAAKLVNIEAIGLSGEAAPWALKSPSGTVATGERRLMLHAPVTGSGQWSSGEPFSFTGSAVWVDDRKRQFYSSEPLTIDSDTRNAKARGFTAGFDGKTLQLTHPELSYDLGD